MRLFNKIVDYHVLSDAHPRRIYGHIEFRDIVIQ